MAPLPKRRRLSTTPSPDIHESRLISNPMLISLSPSNTLSVPSPASQNILLPRQTSSNSVFILTSSYSGLNSGGPPGTVAGIVLGVVGALCFVLWLLSLVANIGQGGVSEEIIVTRQAVPEVAKPEAEEEMAEIRRQRRTRRRREEEIIEVVEEPAEDVIEVIEEEDDYDRERERERERERRRRRSRTEGGYRTVDPDAYAGGDGRTRRVR